MTETEREGESNNAPGINRALSSSEKGTIELRTFADKDNEASIIRRSYTDRMAVRFSMTGETHVL